MASEMSEKRALLVLVTCDSEQRQLGRRTIIRVPAATDARAASASSGIIMSHRLARRLTDMNNTCHLHCHAAPLPDPSRTCTVTASLRRSRAASLRRTPRDYYTVTVTIPGGGLKFKFKLNFTLT